MIKIKKSKTADLRTSDFKNVTKEVLLESTEQHMKDVAKALLFFIDMIEKAALTYDDHKLKSINEFHKAFTSGFNDETWWNEHKKERHHIVTDVIIEPETLMKAFENSVQLLIDNVEVEEGV